MGSVTIKNNFFVFFLRVNLALMHFEVFQFVLLGTLIKGCWILISILNQMQIIYFFMYEQNHLLSSINFAMHKIKPGTLITGTVKINFKSTIERYKWTIHNEFLFTSSTKRTVTYWKQLLHVVLVIGKQLEIPTFFLTLSCVDLRWEELLHVINKIKYLAISEEELKSLSYESLYNLLSNNPLALCSIKLDYFSKTSYWMVHWEKQSIYNMY